MGANAGIRAVKLEELERRLRNDLMHEAMLYGSKVLLHRELGPNSSTANGPTATTRAGTPQLASQSPSRSPSLPQLPPHKRSRLADLESADSLIQIQVSDDVTKKEEGTEAEQLVAYWEGTGARPAGSC